MTFILAAIVLIWLILLITFGFATLWIHVALVIALALPIRRYYNLLRSREKKSMSN